jgi:PH domain
MAGESFVFQNLFSNSPKAIKDSKLLESLSERVKSSPGYSPTLTEFFKPHMEGEMFRYKKSSKELSIPRWCVLSSSNFQYFKTRFSAMCEEKPLLSININQIIQIKAITNGKENIIEIITNNEELTSPLNSKLSLRSVASERHLMNKPRHLESKPLKFTRPTVSTTIIPSPSKNIKKKNSTVREGKNSWTSRENIMYITEERLIFIVTNKDEWEMWQTAFKTTCKVEISREIN